MNERVDLYYQRHRIVAAIWKGKPAAAVYDGTAKVFETGGASLGAAADEARSWVDQRLDAQEAVRRSPHIGTKDEYLRALRALSIAPHHLAMLRAHANAAAGTLTATDLARAAGYGSYEAANAHYGRLGRRMAEFLGITPPISRRRGEPVWPMVLAGGAGGDDEHGYRRWVIHPELVDALRELNMA